MDTVGKTQTHTDDEQRKNEREEGRHRYNAYASGRPLHFSDNPIFRHVPSSLPSCPIPRLEATHIRVASISLATDTKGVRPVHPRHPSVPHPKLPKVKVKVERHSFLSRLLLLLLVPYGQLGLRLRGRHHSCAFELFLQTQSHRLMLLLLGPSLDRTTRSRSGGLGG